MTMILSDEQNKSLTSLKVQCVRSGDTGQNQRQFETANFWLKVGLPESNKETILKNTDAVHTFVFSAEYVHKHIANNLKSTSQPFSWIFENVFKEMI